MIEVLTVKRKLLVGMGVLVAVFTAWVATIVMASAVVKSRVPVSLPPTIQVLALGESFVAARGTWVIEGDKQAFPLQTTQIHCESELRRCTSATSRIGYGDQMLVDIDFHEVTEWGRSRVVFVDDSPACVRYIYTIDLLTQSANAVRLKREKPLIKDASCEGLEKQLRLTLKGGFDVMACA